MQNPIHFSKRSRRAIVIFTITMIVVVLIPRFYFLINPPQKFTFSQTPFQKEHYKNIEFKKREKKKYFKKSSKFKVPSSKFDPNKYTEADWIKLGMSPKQAALILKFGKRGFYSAEDLKRVFVISDKFFAIIKDSLVFPDKPAYSKFEKSTFEIKKVAKVEINNASEEELLNVKGVGPFFAKQIVKKRNELGGFINKEQLLEVWKFDQEKLDIISPNITVNSALIQKININTAPVELLKAHPYIRWNIANSIVKMRAQIGTFKRIEDLRKSVLITAEVFEKLKPYLMVE
jgi:competence ComEA-like helix-hairpin-helix protein